MRNKGFFGMMNGMVEGCPTTIFLREGGMEEEGGEKRKKKKKIRDNYKKLKKENKNQTENR